jgi:hypothetical protein
MGSYPALGIRPPEQPDPLGQYQKAMSLKSLMLGQQAAQQEQQLRGIQVQQAQTALQDQQTVSRLFAQNNGDLDKTIADAAKAGVQPQTLTGLQTHALDVKTKMATLTKDQLANISQQNDNAVGLIQPILDAPPEKQPILYAQARQQALSNPTAYGISDPSQIPEQFPGIDALKSQIAIHKGGKQYAEDAIKQQDAADKHAKSVAELPGLQAESDQKVRSNAASQLAAATSQQDYAQRLGELPYKVASQFPAPEQWTPDLKQSILNVGMTPHEQATVPTATLSMQDWLKKNPGKGPSDYEVAMKKVVPAFNFNLQNGTGGNPNPQPTDASGQPLTGDALYKSFGNKAGQVRAIVEGRQAAPSSFAQKSPYWQDVMQKVYMVDPQWSETRAQIRKAFTTGADGRNIGALNTAAVHLDTLSEAAKGLDNGSFRPGNQLWNSVKTMFGASAPTTFEGIRDAVASEMASALKGNATDIEIASLKKQIMSSNSPQQLSDLINGHLHILDQKLNTYRERYQQQNPGDTVWNPVLPTASGVFAKHGIEAGGGGSQATAAPAGGGTVNMRAPNGQIKAVPADQVEYYKQRGAKVVP